LCNAYLQPKKIKNRLEIKINKKIYIIKGIKTKNLKVKELSKRLVIETNLFLYIQWRELNTIYFKKKPLSIMIMSTDDGMR